MTAPSTGTSLSTHGPGLAPRTQPHVLTIAGSDSSGGAGIQADIKTISAFGCYASSVITAVTAQNTTGVKAVHSIPPAFVLSQLQAIWHDTPPVVVKIGMLASAEIVGLVADFLWRLPKRHRPLVVLDPVMVSTSGHTLLPDDAIQAIKDELMPNVDWVTPNIPEAVKLLGGETEVQTLEDMMGLDLSNPKAEKEYGRPTPHVLFKGGHLSLDPHELRALPKDTIWHDGQESGECVEVLDRHRFTTGLDPLPDSWVVDILRQRDGTRRAFVGRKMETSSTHGTGCTLSAAIASCLALAVQDGTIDSPDTPASIVRRSTAYVRSAISAAFPFGYGHGPLNHSVLTAPRALPQPTPTNPHPFISHLINSDLPLWHSYVRHPFVLALGAGTLPRPCFEHYIKQDYHYLRHYARAHALGAFKASTFDEIEAFTQITMHIARESSMHVGFCEAFGISKDELERTPEAAACNAYALYVIDVGQRGDVLDLWVAVASCLIGYGEVGLWLDKRVKTGEAVLEGNKYRKWMEDYKGDEFIGAVHRGIQNLERIVAADPPSPARLARLTKIWQDCVRLERDFWQMGLDHAATLDHVSMAR